MSVLGERNRTIYGALAATSDVTPVFRYRRDVNGLASFNTVALILSGAWTGTVTLQASSPDYNSWVDVPGFAFTVNVATGLTFSGSIDLRWIFTSRTTGTALGHIVV